jgi:hypothetical protein
LRNPGTTWRQISSLSGRDPVPFESRVLPTAGDTTPIAPPPMPVAAHCDTPANTPSGRSAVSDIVHVPKPKKSNSTLA